MEEHGRPDQAGTVRCDACERVSHSPEQGWRRYLGVNADDQVEVVVYCPDCLEELHVDD